MADNADIEIDVRAFLTMNVPANKLLADLRLNDLSEIFEGALQFELSGVELYEETKEKIASLKRLGFKIAVCSNLAFEYGETVRKFLPEVDQHIFSYEVGEAKPIKKIFRRSVMS